MKFRLPKQIELGGATITVKESEGLTKHAGALGQSIYDTLEIHLDQKLKPEDVKAITYYHELTHFILHTMGQNELNRDEGFVDNFANLLWQSIKTAKY